MNKPKVSIIIPCFNSELTIEETLNSCIQQTYNNLEILVVNDHSTDTSSAIIERFARTEKRIKSLQNPRKGAQAARNYGLEVATGAFVKFFDSDDCISEELICEQVGVLSMHPYGIAHCQWAHFNSNPGDLPVDEQNTYSDFDKVDEFLSKLWIKGMYPPHAWLIPKELLEHCRWDETLTQNQDGDFFARVISRAKSMHFSKGTAYYRLPTTGNTSQKKGPEHIQSHIQALESYAKVCKSFGHADHLEQAFQQQLYNVAYRASTTVCELDFLESILSSQSRTSLKISYPSQFMRILSLAFGIPASLRIRARITWLQHCLYLR